MSERASACQLSSRCWAHVAQWRSGSATALRMAGILPLSRQALLTLWRRKQTGPFPAPGSAAVKIGQIGQRIECTTRSRLQLRFPNQRLPDGYDQRELLPVRSGVGISSLLSPQPRLTEHVAAHYPRRWMRCGVRR